ncbi:MAG: hypothetical protein UY72_C0047G0005 [Candidatus Uhrbacteria bacterium GW2011_GWD2_52_7]|uniref:Uncharacterized protein n=1 Tax=Candidatus Uhrbacteria bacterium GW2011_GWD2_52_7 TaxID=1618989 RepID=A0A0G2AAG7_9BACT|nr:MAG: hypothetical protein UY72_C0047G0005 [Candidatus Uhrbacteria bacterium GW2011_GWD2_52_7]
MAERTVGVIVEDMKKIAKRLVPLEKKRSVLASELRKAVEEGLKRGIEDANRDLLIRYRIDRHRFEVRNDGLVTVTLTHLSEKGSGQALASEVFDPTETMPWLERARELILAGIGWPRRIRGEFPAINIYVSRDYFEDVGK